MSDKKNILIISYVFPPHYGVGGRRWAKHASELTKLNYRVHVICAKNLFRKTSIWNDLIEKNPNIIVHQIPARYPKALVEFEQGILQKILYRIFVFLLPIFTKGSYLDRTSFWKKTLLRKAEIIIRENNIKHVIATGGPFGAMYYTTLLKEKFNDLFILNDMRDPWTWGPNWGFPSLSEKRMEFEKNREFVTVRDSDYISTPSEHLKEYLIDKYPKYKNKFIHIPHFFDPEEVSVHEKTKSDKLRLIMYGNIYHNIDAYIQHSARVLAKYKDSVILDIYTDKFQHESTFTNAGATNVKFHKQIPAKLLFEKFKDYDFVFLYNPDYNRNNISTKYYEIIQTRTPILFFCQKGLGTDFVTNNNLGLHSDLENLESTIQGLLTKKTSFNYNHTYDGNQNSLEKITGKVSDILELNNNFIAKESESKKNLLLTFDYELFLGKRSGSVYNCILLPTELILKSLSRHHLKHAIFFIDTTYIWRLKKLQKNKAKEDLETLQHQLNKILTSGHYIFPHLHPHWIDAVYLENINEWDLSDKTKYRFHNISHDQKKEIFDFSIQFIEQLQKNANVSYPIDSYRAGGWCIEPFEDFRPFFDSYGIKNDFSVLKDFSLTDKDSFYNFENFPSRLIYNFNKEISKIETNGKYRCYSITSIHVTKLMQIINKIYLKVMFKLGYDNFGDGMSTRKLDQLAPDETSENAYFTKKEIEMTSIELMTSVKQKTYRTFIQNNSMIHFISHPKMISTHNINCFNRFLKDVLLNFKVETDYKKMN